MGHPEKPPRSPCQAGPSINQKMDRAICSLLRPGQDSCRERGTSPLLAGENVWLCECKQACARGCACTLLRVCASKMCVPARTNTGERSCPQAIGVCMHKHLWACMHACVHAHARACTHACARTHTSECSCPHAKCACMHKHMCACTHMHLCACTHVYTSLCACTHTSDCSWPHAKCVCVHTRASMCMHTRACPPMCTHMCMRAPHAWGQDQPPWRRQGSPPPCRAARPPSAPRTPPRS